MMDLLEVGDWPTWPIVITQNLGGIYYIIHVMYIFLVWTTYCQMEYFEGICFTITFNTIKLSKLFETLMLQDISYENGENKIIP